MVDEVRGVDKLGRFGRRYIGAALLRHCIEPRRTLDEPASWPCRDRTRLWLPMVVRGKGTATSVPFLSPLVLLFAPSLPFGDVNGARALEERAVSRCPLHIVRAVQHRMTSRQRRPRLRLAGRRAFTFGIVDSLDNTLNAGAWVTSTRRLTVNIHLACLLPTLLLASRAVG
ncbi:hypothetical protein EXIGLDRAFT_462741 [Exidia glandulosa HHB12029]|uniref:Uncharacterized protein n=1 Tax=Exidia glandulosa HHB12029 TaxID=1314781 RepID=A0A165K405_EXIGL|nr:hypothetical protein EXIGLDRAFT_462741 [Exidia glandulosa HHB12029]